MIIINGLIYDGMGNAPYMGAVRLEGERIVQVGPDLAPMEGEAVLDACQMAVTPGFVDMHRHCDKSPFEKGEKMSYGAVMLRQGITSTVTGNCGISMVPLSGDRETVRMMRDYYEPVLGDIRNYDSLTDYAAYMRRLRETPLPVNTGAMIGMGAIRIAVKGFSEKPFTKEEIVRCREVVRDAMERGAPGVSIGLMYLPECHETAEELGEILKPVGEYGRIVTAHIRGEGDSLVKSVEEVIRIGRLAGCHVEISHFKACGVHNWNREIHLAIAAMEEARRRGQQVDCDFYPYDCGSTTLMSMIPPDFTGGNFAEAIDRLRTPAGREQLRKSLAKCYPDWDNYAVSLGWDKVVIAAVGCEENRGMIGKNIPEITQEYGYRDEVETVAHILTSENGNAAIIIRSMDQRDVDTVAALPDSCVISDAIYAQTDHPHPRMYGAFPHFWREYVCERRILKPETAIQKMTFLPARRMGISMRGALKSGYYADINIFSPEKFCDRADYADSMLPAEGLEYCILNGQVVVRADRVLREDCGKVICAGQTPDSHLPDRINAHSDSYKCCSGITRENRPAFPPTF